MRNFAFALLMALRPKQWMKNILVFAAPFAAGKISSSDLSNAFIAFFAFCIASSLGYILNDLIDVEIDRAHPKKRLRPFASGFLSVRSGIFLFAFLTVILFASTRGLPSGFTMILCLYLFNSILYSYFLKRLPVIEMFSVAIGFVLRLISGALALNLTISEWFLIVGGFGALFVVSAKRLAELKQNTERKVRIVVTQYTTDFLSASISISVSICVSAYCFWAFTQVQDAIWYQISVIPFVISLFRYRWMSEGNEVESPEDALFSDKTLLSLAVMTLLSLVIAIF